MTQATFTSTQPSPPACESEDYITYEQYLEEGVNEGKFPERSEWVDGKVVLLPMSVSNQHDAITQWLSDALSPYARRTGGRLCRDPFNMKTGPDLPGRAPDLLVVRSEHLHRLDDKCLRGPADLAIEVVSPDSRTVDHMHKYSEYQAGGVPEYWLIDPDRREAFFFQPDDTGNYQPITPDAERRLHSRVLSGVWIKPEWLWSGSPPDPLEILRGWGF